MCGIIGYSGKLTAKKLLINGLYSLEYRGYDSAGICLHNKKDFDVIKCCGRVEKLDEMCKAIETESTCGIGHTRWATHGVPSKENAHPHTSNGCALVHNGIIENYAEIRESLMSDGYTFLSETDTECIVHLIDYYYQRTFDPLISIRQTIQKLKGSFAIAVMFKDRENEIWAVRRDNPLIAAKNSEGTYIASDIPALLCYSKKILRPKDDEIICIDGEKISLFNTEDKKSEPKYDEIDWNIGTAQKDGFDHFMLKEIYEQPKAIKNTTRLLINSEGLPDLKGIGLDYEKLSSFDSVSIIGCGSATHAGLVGKYIIEQLVKIPVFVTNSSEYRYCPPVTVGRCLTIAVSQSGETADTIAALRLAKKSGNESLGIINAVGSAIARESDYVLYTNAGQEIAVATTKGYTTQLCAFVILAISLALSKNSVNKDYAKALTTSLINTVPENISSVLCKREIIKSIAKTIYKNDDLYFIGRGTDNFAGIECSLKLKEISYIHSEAYAAGELKHGTLSLIEEGTPVIALATDSRYYDKMLGNIREVKSRGGKIIMICGNDFPSYEEISDYSFELEQISEYLSPMITVVVAQLIAYETALLCGCDIDHPRNLAKSVTVE